MLQKFILTTAVLAVHLRWDELREYFALMREIRAQATTLSPEDQARLDQTFDAAVGITAKVDTAQKA